MKTGHPIARAVVAFKRRRRAALQSLAERCKAERDAIDARTAEITAITPDDVTGNVCALMVRARELRAELDAAVLKPDGARGIASLALHVAAVERGHAEALRFAGKLSAELSRLLKRRRALH
jgi:hypothetical protein